MSELELHKKEGYIDYTRLMSAMVLALAKYQESCELSEAFDIDVDDYLYSREVACQTIEDAVSVLISAKEGDYPDIAKEMIDNMISLLRDYYSFSLMQSFIDKRQESILNVSTYLVRNAESKLVKIGKSSNVNRRLQELQCGAGLRLECVGVIPKDVESQLHKKFSEKRVFGEWFDDSDGSIRSYFKKQS